MNNNETLVNIALIISWLLSVFGTLFAIVGIIDMVKKEKTSILTDVKNFLIKIFLLDKKQIVREENMQSVDFDEYIYNKAYETDAELTVITDEAYETDTEMAVITDEAYETDTEFVEQTGEKVIIITCWPTFLDSFHKVEKSDYYKDKKFFDMQNNGSNPCEIEKPIVIEHTFNEEQMYM